MILCIFFKYNLAIIIYMLKLQLRTHNFQLRFLIFLNSYCVGASSIKLKKLLWLSEYYLLLDNNTIY